MRTDVVLDHVAGGRRIVIDTKFNSIVTKGWFREESVRSGYVYQIYAYLMSQSGEVVIRWISVHVAYFCTRQSDRQWMKRWSSRGARFALRQLISLHLHWQFASSCLMCCTFRCTSTTQRNMHDAVNSTKAESVFSDDDNQGSDLWD